MSTRWTDESGYDDPPVVCIAHGRFVPCRKQGEHRTTDNYHGSTIEGLTWEPAWERA